MLRYRLAILGAAVLWSSSGAAIKLSTLSGWQISFGRAVIAAAVLALLFKEARARLDRRLAWVSLAYAGTVVLYVLANKLTTAANAIFLQDTAPLYVLAFSPLLLGEKPSRGELYAAPLFLLGLTLFFFDKLAPGQFEGNLVALASGVCFALTIMGLRLLGQRNMAALVWGNLFAAAASLPMALLGPAPTPLDYGLVAFLGVFQLGVSYALFAYGLKGTKATEASLLILLEPVLNPIWTFLFAGERPGPWALTGGALILIGTLWRTLAPSRAAAPVREAAPP